ncbi:MAG: lamin tail domain-containing protein [Myxococcales bacterium]
MRSNTVRTVRVSLLSLGAALSACAADPEAPSDEVVSLPDTAAALASVPAPELVDLVATRDTSINQRAPDRNEGTSPLLDHGRALVAFDNAALKAAVGESDQVLSAKLRLTPPASGQPFFSLLGVYRMTQTWTELGATFSCAVDGDASNRAPDCSGETAWSMGFSPPNPWTPFPSALAFLMRGDRGSVELDVTRDVQRMLTGEVANEGWLLLSSLLGDYGGVFQSREAAQPPVLELEVRRCNATLCDDGNGCTLDLCDEDARCLYQTLDDGDACDDGDPCSAGDVCGAGVCAPGNTLTCGSEAQVLINEVESSGGVPGDWIELYNAGDRPVDVSGWVLKDNDDSHAYALPQGSVLAPDAYLSVDESALGFGLGGADSARLYDATGDEVDSYSWTAHAGVTYARCPNGAGDFRNATSSTKSGPNDCTPPPPCTAAAADCRVVVNEVESNNGSPGDWIELYNPGQRAVDLSGWIVRDNDDTHTYALNSGAVLQPGAFLVVDEAQLGFGLGSADAARVFTPSGGLVDTYAWTSHAAITYGRCPDGTGSFGSTASATKGSANDCAVGPAFSPWAGAGSTAVVDPDTTFASNLSGLSYEPANGNQSGALWGVQNGPSVLWKLQSDGAGWSPDPSDGWGGGKTLVYPNGAGSPDAEGMTRADWASSAVYVVTERDNDNKDVSRISVLRFDTEGSATILTATHEWNLTADLPPSGANTGAEAIAWVPDAYLVAHGFRDESRGAAYDPAFYPDHAGGVFLVGLESVGTLYAYVLDHVSGSFQRVASMASGQPMSIDLSFDREVGQLWSYCDDACGNRATILRVEEGASSPDYGKFTLRAAYERPAGMTNLANEGIAIASEAECQAGTKPFFWADDSDTDGHSLREGAVQCGTLP